MTTRQLLRWQRTHARRMARAGALWTSAIAAAIAAAASVFMVVAWRGQTSVTGASHAWLGATIVVFGVAFLRVPAHLYWRPDAMLLAQLPIGGRPLLDVALLRCAAAAGAITMIAVVGAVPLLALDADSVGEATRALLATPIAGDPVPRLSPAALFVRHAVLACLLGLVAAGLIPAVAMWSASLVATGRADRAIRTAAVLAGSADNHDNGTAAPPPSSGATVLGAVPGAAASAAIAVVILVSPWLLNRPAPFSALVAFAIIAAASIGSLAAIRSTGAPAMPLILREMTALDRQQLATLELHPPTAIERGIASVLGRSAVWFRKDARLMRRRYPMAFALGALAFAVLIIVGFTRPESASWLHAVVIAASAYGAVLARRLWRPPVELSRLSAALPGSSAARAGAKVAWLATWTVLFIALPAVFAWLRGW